MSHEDTSLSAEHIIDTLRESLLFLDEKMQVVSANKAFYQKFEVSKEETVGRSIFCLGNGQWDIPSLHHLLETIIPEKTSFDNFEVKHTFEKIGEKVMELNARRLIQKPGKPGTILIAIEDITDQYFAQKKIAVSEAKYHKFVEDIKSIIIGFNREGKINFFNHFSEKLFGFNRDEVIGKPFIGTIIPCIDSHGKDNSIICEDIFVNSANYYANESECVCKDGKRIWMSWSAKAMYDDVGKVIEILIDGNDITELAAIRKKLEDKSSTLDALLQFIPEGIIITDSKNVVRNTSHYISELLRLPADKIFHTNEAGDLDLLQLYLPNGEKLGHPDDFPLSKAASTGQQFSDYELLLKFDGTTRVISTNAAPIRDSKGTIVGAIGALRDITEHKKQLSEVEERKLVLNAIMEYSPEGIMLVDKDAKVTEISRFLVELLQIPKDELVGFVEKTEQWGILDINTRKPLSFFSMPLYRVIQERKTITDEEFLLLRFGEERAISISAGPVLNSNGEVIGGGLYGGILQNRKVFPEPMNIKESF